MDGNELLSFRTKKCVKKQCDFGLRCKYSHSEIIRRCPFYVSRVESLDLRYVPVPCPYMFELKCIECPSGERCPYAHSFEEINYHPLVYKTLPCDGSSAECALAYDRPQHPAPRCPDHSCCWRYHGPHDRRVVYKQQYRLPFTSGMVIHTIAAVLRVVSLQDHTVIETAPFTASADPLAPAHLRPFIPVTLKAVGGNTALGSSKQPVSHHTFHPHVVDIRSPDDAATQDVILEKEHLRVSQMNSVQFPDSHVGLILQGIHFSTANKPLRKNALAAIFAFIEHLNRYTEEAPLDRLGMLSSIAPPSSLSNNNNNNNTMFNQQQQQALQALNNLPNRPINGGDLQSPQIPSNNLLLQTNTQVSNPTSNSSSSHVQLQQAQNYSTLHSSGSHGSSGLLSSTNNNTSKNMNSNNNANSFNPHRHQHLLQTPDCSLPSRSSHQHHQQQQQQQPMRNRVFLQQHHHQSNNPSSSSQLVGDNRLQSATQNQQQNITSNIMNNDQKQQNNYTSSSTRDSHSKSGNKKKDMSAAENSSNISSTSFMTQQTYFQQQQPYASPGVVDNTALYFNLNSSALPPPMYANSLAPSTTANNNGGGGSGNNLLMGGGSFHLAAPHSTHPSSQQQQMQNHNMQNHNMQYRSHHHAMHHHHLHHPTVNHHSNSNPHSNDNFTNKNNSKNTNIVCQNNISSSINNSANHLQNNNQADFFQMSNIHPHALIQQQQQQQQQQSQQPNQQQIHHLYVNH